MSLIHIILAILLALLAVQEQDHKPAPTDGMAFDASALIQGKGAPSTEAIAEALRIHVARTTKQDRDVHVRIDATDDSIVVHGNSGAMDTIRTFLDTMSGKEPRERVTGAMLYVDAAPTRDGIGRYFFEREIAQVMGHLGANWLERPSREKEERTSLLIELLGVQTDSDVADIGAGTGYFTFPIARKASEGTVHAVDIQPEMLEFIEARKRHDQVSNVDAVLGRIDDASLPPDSIDIAFAVDAYHEFSNPWEMLQSIKRALRPGGTLILVEFRLEDPEVPIKRLHKMSEAQARRELEAAGFEWVRTDSALPRQHVLVFRKPAGTRTGTP